jgi:hypothetical protein
LGVSDRPYFAWLRAALARYEAGSGHLSALGRERSPLDLWVLAGARTNPGIEFVQRSARTTPRSDFSTASRMIRASSAWTSMTSRACRMTPATSS